MNTSGEQRTNHALDSSPLRHNLSGKALQSFKYIWNFPIFFQVLQKLRAGWTWLIDWLKCIKHKASHMHEQWKKIYISFAFLTQNTSATKPPLFTAKGILISRLKVIFKAKKCLIQIYNRISDKMFTFTCLWVVFC